MDNEQALRWSRRLGIVPRWVVVPTIQSQTVAEHCFHVTRTAMWLLEVLPDTLWKGMHRSDYEVLIIRLALAHDDDEAATGDSPSPTKGPKDFSTYTTSKLIVKVADLLESLAFLYEERAMGNTRIVEVTKDAHDIYSRAWLALAQQYASIGIELVTADQTLSKYLTILNCKHPGLEARQ